MKACIDEIKEVEQRAKDEGKKPEFSRNEICEKHGISPSSVSKHMTGKVKGYNLVEQEEGRSCLKVCSSDIEV